MALEIERRFLVRDGSVVRGLRGVPIRQAFLELKKEGVLRIRVAGDEASLTVKILRKAAVRIEYEYPIPLGDAEEMLGLCDFPPLEKDRYPLFFGGREWVVDVFRGENEGLLIAEIELEREDAAFALPPWAGREITGDSIYLNTHLYRYPFRSWPR
jgi:CYTH domain-containing protein